MKYAEVAVNSPGSRSTFCYAVPPGLSISVGEAVWVPFGARVIQGIVLCLSDEPSVAEPREIAGIVAEAPLLSPLQVELGQWMSERYYAPLFDALSLMMPPGFGRRTIAYFQAADFAVESPLTPEQRLVLHMIEKKRQAWLSWRRQLVKEKPGGSPINCWTAS